MTERFYPDRFMRRVFGSNYWTQSLLTQRMTFRQAAMQAILKATGISKRKVNATVYKVLDEYDKKAEKLEAEGVEAFRKDAINNEKLLRQRVEMLVLYNEVKEQKEEHAGEYYRWLPSESKVPDPEHQLLYGKIFKVGEGDKNGNMPCERYGCKCGIEWLTLDEVEKLKKRKV